MVSIINRGHQEGQDPKTGICNYDVLINFDYITSFSHKRSDGLGVCLEKAAIAVNQCKKKRGKNNGR